MAPRPLFLYCTALSGHRTSLGLALGWRNSGASPIIPPAFREAKGFFPRIRRISAQGRIGQTGGRDLGDGLKLDNRKQRLKQYYAGQQIESPNGGFLMLLGVRKGDDGSATGIFECSVSSLRYQIAIPKATRTERKKVKDVIDAGGDPGCPRHGVDERLARAGRELVCRACGVAYAKT